MEKQNSSILRRKRLKSIILHNKVYIVSQTMVSLFIYKGKFSWRRNDNDLLLVVYKRGREISHHVFAVINHISEWLTVPLSMMKRILCSDWLLEPTPCTYLPVYLTNSLWPRNKQCYTCRVALYIIQLFHDLSSTSSLGLRCNYNKIEHRLPLKSRMLRNA